MQVVREDPLSKERRLLRKLTQNPTPDQVHGFRTTARRIEALLTAVLGRPGKNEKKLLKQLERVRRRAGRVRDLDVQIGNLQELQLGREGQCKLRVLQHLKAGRRKAIKKLLSELDERTVSRIHKRLLRTGQKVSKARGAKSKVGTTTPKGPNVISLTAKRMQKLQSKLPLSEKTLHEYRLRCKRLRYTLELSSDPEAARLIEHLKSIQNAVGKWHDSVVLLETARSVIDHEGNCGVISALRNLSQAQLWQALQVTRGAAAVLAGSPSRKPVESKAPPVIATAASA